MGCMRRVPTDGRAEKNKGGQEVDFMNLASKLKDRAHSHASVAVKKLCPENVLKVVVVSSKHGSRRRSHVSPRGGREEPTRIVAKRCP